MMIGLKQAIDHLASPLRGRKQILPVAAARRIRRALGTDPLTAYELVVQLLEKAAEKKKHRNAGRARFMEPEGGRRFWRAVAREVGWAQDLETTDLILLTSLCARHYLHGTNSDDDERVKNMIKSAKKWCDLLVPDELQNIDGRVSYPNITNEEMPQSDSERHESAGVRVAAGAGGGSSSHRRGSDEFRETYNSELPFPSTASTDTSSSDDTFVSEREANRLRQQATARWNAIRRFSGDTAVETEQQQQQPRRGRFLEHFD
ncbi:hypothetical protein PG991_015219 [Apiospora marii]|uniref:Uncharacterized protein n=1 Tax=Apiospora marii TaxID=335849 RepID=A0ABR1R127_9PEZI